MTERPFEVYLDRVRVPLARLRLDPLRLDWLVAGVLTLGLELEVGLGCGAAHHRLVAAVAGPLTAAAVTVRRLYPATAGVGAGLIASVVAAVWGPPSVVSYGIAWMCAIYGLAVWARPRRFAVGAAAITPPRRPRPARCCGRSSRSAAAR